MDPLTTSNHFVVSDLPLEESASSEAETEEPQAILSPPATFPL